MTNRDKIEMLRGLHSAMNDQLCDNPEAEAMQLYTIGIGGKVFTFPATIVYRVMFDRMFEAWDELKDDQMAGIDGPLNAEDEMEVISQSFDELWQKLDDLNDKYTD